MPDVWFRTDEEPKLSGMLWERPKEASRAGSLNVPCCLSSNHERYLEGRPGHNCWPVGLAEPNCIRGEASSESIPADSMYRLDIRIPMERCRGGRGPAVQLENVDR